MEDYEALTEEEIERIKEKKRLRRERRRKQRMKKLICRWAIVIGIALLVLILLIKIIMGIAGLSKKNKKTEEASTEAVTTEATTEAIVANIDEGILAKDMPADRDAAIAVINEAATTDPKMKTIADNVAAYPDYILMNVAVNTEMADFAISYPAKINVAFDGEFELDVDMTEIPFMLQYDEKWGYADYGENLVGIHGQAPTCLSMVYTFLKQDKTMNPIKVADFATAKGYLDSNGVTTDAIIENGAAELGLKVAAAGEDTDSWQEALAGGKFIICSLKEGDFTKAKDGYIVIRDFKDGLYYVSDPTSTARSQVGWDFERLKGQINKAWVLGTE